MTNGHFSNVTCGICGEKNRSILITNIEVLIPQEGSPPQPKFRIKYCDHCRHSFVMFGDDRRRNAELTERLINDWQREMQKTLGVDEFHRRWPRA